MNARPGIVPYQAGMKEAIMGLMGNQHVKAWLWDWQFEGNPFCERFDPVVACLNERVVGFNGVMPVCLSTGQEMLSALWSCDFYVDGSVRGQGVGRLIKEALHEKSSRIMALGVSDQAAPVLSRMGWDYVPCMRILHHIRGIHSWRDAVFKTMQGMNRLVVLSGALTSQVAWSPDLPDEPVLRVLWDQMRESWTGVQVARTPEYMRWKYTLHPAASYEFALLKTASEPKGMLVCRIEGHRVHIVDYVGVHDIRIKTALLRDLMAEYSQHRHILLSTSDKQFDQAARSLGFYKGRYATRFFVYQRDRKPGSLASQDWFLMGGDSDGELLAATHSRLRIKEKYS